MTCRHYRPAEPGNAYARCTFGPFAASPMPIAAASCATCQDREEDAPVPTDLTVPGIYHGVPFADYLAIPAVSNSGVLKPMATSAKRCRYLRDNPPADRTVWRRGRAVHTALWEPDEFPTRYVIEPKFTGTGSKAAREDWKLLHAGCEVLKPADRDAAIGGAKAISEDPHAMDLLAGDGAAEVTLVWVDPVTGLLCKARPDWVCDPRHHNRIVDLKGTRAINARQFGAQCAQLGYGIAAAHYLSGWHVLTGETREWSWIAVELRDEFDVAVWHADPVVIAEAHVTRADLLAKYATALESDVWPGQCPEPATLPWPRWAQPNEDDITGTETDTDW